MMSLSLEIPDIYRVEANNLINLLKQEMFDIYEVIYQYGRRISTNACYKIRLTSTAMSKEYTKSQLLPNL